MKDQIWGISGSKWRFFLSIRSVLWLWELYYCKILKIWRKKAERLQKEDKEIKYVEYDIIYVHSVWGIQSKERLLVINIHAIKSGARRQLIQIFCSLGGAVIQGRYMGARGGGVENSLKNNKTLKIHKTKTPIPSSIIFLFDFFLSICRHFSILGTRPWLVFCFQTSCFSACLPKLTSWNVIMWQI